MVDIQKFRSWRMQLTAAVPPESGGELELEAFGLAFNATLPYPHNSSARSADLGPAKGSPEDNIMRAV
jgi:hypothetical protein